MALIVILLVSTASISIFLLNKETEKRKAVETELNKAQDTLTKLQGDLKVAQNKVFILEEKNKEADTRINNLEEEMDVEKGLKEAMKNENDKLKTDLDSARQDRDKVQTDLAKRLEEAAVRLRLAGHHARVCLRVGERHERLERRARPKVVAQRARARRPWRDGTRPRSVLRAGDALAPGEQEPGDLFESGRDHSSNHAPLVGRQLVCWHGLSRVL